MLKILNIFICFVCISGCGAIDHHLVSVRNAAQTIQDTRIKYEGLYLGKSKDVLIADFGSPTVRGPGITDGKRYDEEWSYITKGSAWNLSPGGAVWFYITDGKVSAVDVF